MEGGMWVIEMTEAIDDVEFERLAEIASRQAGIERKQPIEKVVQRLEFEQEQRRRNRLDFPVIRSLPYVFNLLSSRGLLHEALRLLHRSSHSSSQSSSSTRYYFHLPYVFKTCSHRESTERFRGYSERIRLSLAPPSDNWRRRFSSLEFSFAFPRPCPRSYSWEIE